MLKSILLLSLLVMSCIIGFHAIAQDFAPTEQPTYSPPWVGNEVIFIVRWTPGTPNNAYANAEIIIYDINGRPRLLRLPNTGPMLLSAAQRDKKLDWWINYCENKLQTWISSNGGWAPPPPSGG